MNTRLGTSVIIIHFERERFLRNTLIGLARQTVLPDEVIIVEMGTSREMSDRYPFELSVVHFGTAWEDLPFAAARNLGAEKSRFETLLFLDVDCIPSHTYCRIMGAITSRNPFLVMATPKYLLSNIKAEFTEATLLANSRYHPSRPLIDHLQKESCYELFWSLCFGVSRTIFQKIDGFDEGYTGYGGEDTDFALRSKANNVPFYLSEAKVFHQQHTVHSPPLNHLSSIVANSERFYTRWGYWPMEDCLEAFSKAGYISWHRGSTCAITIDNMPNESEVRESMLEDAPYR